MSKRTVEYEGTTYRVRSDQVTIPVLSGLPRLHALAWLAANTYARGRSTVRPNPLAGLGGAIRLDVRGG